MFMLKKEVIIVIKINNLTKSFDDKIVLENINLTIPKGSILE